MSEQLLISIGAELSGFNSAMKNVQSSVQDIGNKMKGINGESFKKVGSAVTDAGKKMTLMTAPLMAIGVGALKVGGDFQQSMANVKAVSGATGAEFQALEAKAREMGATTKFSASESADALNFMGMAGWNSQQMIDGLPGVLNLASASGTDLAVTSDILTDAITAFGDKASDAGRYADVMAAASSSANTNVEMLGESFKYVAPVAGAMGYSLEDTSKALALMANNGIKASQGGTSLKNIMTNLASPTKQMQNAMDDLGISILNQDGSMKSLDEVMLNLRDSFDGLTEDQKASYAATLAGKEGMAGLLAIVGASDEDFNKLGNAINNSNGKAQEMADIMNDTLQGRMLAMKSALEELGIVVFKNLEPAFTKIVGLITDLAQWFGNLPAPMQTTIIAFAAIATAIGPVLVVAGTLISSIGSIITAFSAVSGVVAGAGGAMALFTNPVGLVIVAIGLAVAAGIALWKNWDAIGEKFGLVGQVIAGVAAGPIGVIIGGIKLFQEATSDAIPEVQRFSDEVSDSTQKAVGAYMDMSEEADVALKQLAWSQEEVTAEMAENMITQQQAITDNLLSAIDERHQAEVEQTKAQFEQIDSLNEEQKAQILEKLDARFAEEAQVTEEGNARIAEIINNAAEEKRSLTQAESDEILAIRQNMTEQAVSIMSENEAEQKVIYEKMKDNASTISAQEAAEVVKNSVQKKEDVIKEANDQYDETYKWAIRQRDELGTISAEEAKEIIDKAREKRDESVKNAEDMHDKVVKEAKSQAKEHVNEVDWETGEIKSKWEIMKSDTIKKAKEIGSEVKSAFKDLWTNTKSYFSGLWNDTKTYFSNIGTTISTKVEEAKTAASNKITEMKTNFVNRFKEIVSEASSKFIETKNKIVKPIEDARDAIGRAIDAVKKFFSGLSLKFPDIKPPKLPRFTLNGKFSLSPPSVPKVGIQWFAKGGIMKNPTAFGMNGNNLMVGGEAGAEAILPLNNKNLSGIGEGIAKTMQIPLNKQQPQKVENNEENHYHFNFTIQNMTSDRNEARELFKIVSKEITDKLKRERGM